MLVLVLILVVIALVLLLAGWFLHLVVLAWTSVGISVLAGLVLLYDWWQTRNAVRAGRQSGGARDGESDRQSPVGSSGAAAVGAGVAGAGAGAAGVGSGPDGFGGADMEPATQVLPVVPPSANSAEETVVMPVVPPSGSSEAPSGASRSSGSSSLSVTKFTGGDASTTRVGDGATTAVDPSTASDPGGGGDPATGVAVPAEARSETRDGGTGATGAARAPDAAETTTAARADGAPASATQVVATGGTHDPAAGATALTAAAATGHQGGDPTTRADRPGGPSGSAGTDEPTSVAAAGGGVPVDEDRTRAASTVDTSGEAPEEPRDPTHASLVARLPDEVVVIDEHPRYHVQGCPSLPGQPLIPLPVSEAVELGFTPCGWCSPNRTLAERHPAEAR